MRDESQPAELRYRCALAVVTRGRWIKYPPDVPGKVRADSEGDGRGVRSDGGGATSGPAAGDGVEMGDATQAVVPRMEDSFPPPLTPNNRVWTTRGYQEHGPMGGPKVDIAPEMGGVITASVNLPYSDVRLYSVLWDNGQSSRHYAKELFGIGRFASIAEFEAAIEVEHVRLPVGPRGGFAGAEIRLRYDGCHQHSKLFKCDSDREFWVGFLEPIAGPQGAGIETLEPPRSKTKRGSS